MEDLIKLPTYFQNYLSLLSSYKLLEFPSSNGSLNRKINNFHYMPDYKKYLRKRLVVPIVGEKKYERPEGTWGFSKKKAISKSLYRIVQSVLTD